MWKLLLVLGFVTTALANEEPMSYSVEPAVWDEGRMAMNQLLEMKQKSWDAAAECFARGECPEYSAKPALSDIPCGEDGFADIYPCKDVDLLSFTPHADLGPAYSSRRGNDIWGWADGNKEYALMGLNDGTSFVDITEPTKPIVLAFLPSTSNRASSWRDIKVIGNYAYIGSEATGHGMQVFDLTRLRDMDGSMIVTVQPNTTFSGGQSHNIVANTETQRIYIVGATRAAAWGSCSGGLLVVDVSDPSNPTRLGCFGTDGYVHDAECLIYRGPDTDHQGKEVCFCYNENSLTIVDVTSPNNMGIISKKAYIGSQYTHQGWLTEDHTVLLLDDELDESRSTNKSTRTYIWDINDLDDPVLRRTHYSPNPVIDHNQYVLGDLTYQANYEAGLRILRINQDDFSLSEEGYFDVYPSRDAADFFGSWSVYPYLPSGNVIVSSIDYGLFVLKSNVV